LNERFGKYSYKTGASFFLLSKTIGAAARLYIVVLILQSFVFDSLGVPFWINVCFTVLLIWLYTFRSGIKTIVWTDTLQTIVMLGALVLILMQTTRLINMDFSDIFSTLAQSKKTRIFVFDDWYSKQNFFKQFFSGIFIVIVMTGLDQDMMQKNLTCKNLHEAKKNMYWYGISFVPINFLFLGLGAMLLMLATQNNIQLPAVSDEILPMFATNYLGKAGLILFVVGIVAAAFSSADSALTSLTTSFSVDILEIQHQNAEKAKHERIKIHIAISLAFILIILLFRVLNNKSIIDAIYTIVSYTYGPLLGMYAFGLFTKRQTMDKFVPYIAIASPVICALLNWVSSSFFGYEFGYELLMINGLLTFLGMWILGRNQKAILNLRF
jgi:Na+/proline symporter